MERRDLIKDQIDQLTKSIAKVIGSFLGLGNNGFNDRSIEITNDALKTDLNIDIDLVLSLNKTELFDYFNDREFKSNHFEMFSTYFKEVGIRKNRDGNSNLYFEKALELLELADKIEKTLSFDRIKERKLLQQLMRSN